jgi:hypothetical protein
LDDIYPKSARADDTLEAGGDLTSSTVVTVQPSKTATQQQSPGLSTPANSISQARKSSSTSLSTSVAGSSERE